MIEFLLAESMEFVDDLLTFEELGLCLKSHGCYVANLSSSDFSTKNGIGGCLKSLLRQFLMVSLEVSFFSLRLLFNELQVYMICLKLHQGF